MSAFPEKRHRLERYYETRHYKNQDKKKRRTNPNLFKCKWKAFTQHPFYKRDWWVFFHICGKKRSKNTIAHTHTATQAQNIYIAVLPAGANVVHTGQNKM